MSTGLKRPDRRHGGHPPGDRGAARGPRGRDPSGGENRDSHGTHTLGQHRSLVKSFLGPPVPALTQNPTHYARSDISPSRVRPTLPKTSNARWRLGIARVRPDLRASAPSGLLNLEVAECRIGPTLQRETLERVSGVGGAPPGWIPDAIPERLRATERMRRQRKRCRC
jgi:hypothetical protein